MIFLQVEHVDQFRKSLLDLYLSTQFKKEKTDKN